MRMRTSGLGCFCLALLFLGESSALAAVTPVQTATIAPTIPNWSQATASLAGSDPLVFNQFNPALGQLQSVDVTMTYTTYNLVSMRFSVGTTIILRSAFDQTPNAGPTVTLNGPTTGPSTTLLTASSPVSTYTKTDGVLGQVFAQPQSFGDDTTRFTPGSGSFLTPDGQPTNFTNSFTGMKSVTITDPSQLALFTGPGTVGLPASSTAGRTITVDGGNGFGSILTFTGLTVDLSYNYAVPEPSSMALLGLGAGGLLVAGRLRRRRTTL